MVRAPHHRCATDGPRRHDLVRACDRLRTARTALATALSGNTDALEEGFGIPRLGPRSAGNDGTVVATLHGFLGGLPVKDPCDTVALTNWLRDRKRSATMYWTGRHSRADRARRARRCGDDLMGHERTTSRTGPAREPERPRSASSRPTSDACSPEGPTRSPSTAPTRRSTAAPSPSPRPRPPTARCREDTYAPSVESCPYRSESTGALSYVSFHKIEIPVKVYELRTGKLVRAAQGPDQRQELPPVRCAGGLFGRWSSAEPRRGPRSR